MFARSLKTTFTAGLLASTLALSSMTPNSAQAGLSEEEVVGLLSFLFIGAAIHNNRSNRDVETAPEPTVQPGRGGWRNLPEQCQRRMTRRNGNRINFFAQRCLNNNYNFVNRLPEHCHVRFRTAEGQRRQGFRINRH